MKRLELHQMCSELKKKKQKQKQEAHGDTSLTCAAMTLNGSLKYIVPYGPW